MTARLRLPYPLKASALAFTAVLAACGGSDDEQPDVLASYRSQTLQWQSCTAEVLGAETVSVATLAKYGQRLQCAQMRAPMDWSDPSKGDVHVAMMRVVSTDRAQRKASLFFNPGGPGQDGLTMSVAMDRIFEAALPDHPLGSKFHTLRAQYDLVGFSPRGLGASSRLECVIPDSVSSAKSMPALPADLVDASIDEADGTAHTTAAACEGVALKPYINSDATARDLDLMRHLVGDEKLHYFGYSYGTWLGAWYAGLFPEKVGRMVLDSVEDFTVDHEEATRAMAPARERLHREVLVPYFTRHAATFGMDVGATSLAGQIGALDAPLRQVLGSSLGGASYGSSTLDTYGMSLAAAIGLQSVINRLPDETTADELEAALHAHTFHATNRPRDTVIREIALDMAEELAGGDDDDAEGDGAFVNNDKRRATARSQTLPLSSAVYFAVSCNDAPTLTSLSDWRTAMRSDAVAAPLFFSGVAHCMPWGAPTVTKPSLSALTTVPALFVQSQYDGATPAEGAARTFAHMPSSKQVYVPGEYVHALFPYAAQDSDNPCVDHAVLDYLLGSDTSPRSTTCGARPLELDRSISKSTSAHGSAFREPAQARELVEALHATIGRRP